MTGPALAGLVERMVTALNSRDIPSAGSMLEFFNKEASPSLLPPDPSDSCGAREARCHQTHMVAHTESRACCRCCPGGLSWLQIDLWYSLTSSDQSVPVRRRQADGACRRPNITHVEAPV